MKRIADQTLYEILEIPQDASTPAIEAAVERARALYGPGSLATYTLMSPDEAALLGSRIDEARRVLLDAASRARYDASLDPGAVRAAVNGTNGAASPPFTTPVPVIPAVQPPAEPPARVDVPRAAPPPRDAGPPPAPAPRAPIQLDREIPAPATPPAPAVAAAAAPEGVPVPEGAAWTGEALRRVREARGMTIPQIAERTKVTRHHVENIEAERFSALPAPVYLRGILLSLARELRLDGQKVARAYLERAAAATPAKSR